MKIQYHIAEVLRSIENLKDYAISGELHAHEAIALIKEAAIDNFLKFELAEITSVAIENLRNDFLGFNEKSFKDSSYQYTIRGGPTRYYFNDVDEIKEKKMALESTKEHRDLKSCEQKYKTAFLMKQNDQVMVDEKTGEIIDPSKVNVVYFPDSLAIKKRKEHNPI